MRFKFSAYGKEARSPTNRSDHLLHIERVLTLLSDRGARIAILARYAERQQRSRTAGKRRPFAGRPTNDAA